MRAAAGEAPAAGGERLYADLLGRALIVLPLLFGLVLLGLLLLFFLIEGWRRRALGRPLLAMAAALAGSAALAFAGHFIVQLLRAGDYWRAYPLVDDDRGLRLGARRLRRRPCSSSRATASGPGCAPPSGCSSPASARRSARRAGRGDLLPAAAARRRARHGGGSAGSPGPSSAGAIAAALLLFLTLGRCWHLFEELMNGGPLWAFAPLGAAIMLPALIELLPVLSRHARRCSPRRAPLDLAILGWLVAGLTPAYSADRQQLFTIEYVWDESARAGRFAVNNDGAPVPFAADWERAEMPYTTRRRWAAPAPAAPVAAPGSDLGRAAAGRRRPPPPAPPRRQRRREHRPDRAARGAAARGRRAAPSSAASAAARETDKYYLRCVGRACDGAVLDVIVAGAAPVDFTIVGLRPGLPPAAAPLVRARPATARPQYGADATLAIGKVRL